jgi:IPT/TIG domain
MKIAVARYFRSLPALVSLCLALAVAAAALALIASDASAVVVHLRNGHRVSSRPLRSRQRAETVAANKKRVHELEYHGGPVMPSNTNYAFYWRPSGAPAYPAEYQSGLNLFFTDLKHDSGGLQNVDSIAAQYGDSSGESANYASEFGGALEDTDAYPPNGCAAAAICLTDAQLQAELTAYVQAHHLPHDLKHEYFILTPPGVEDCTESTGFECSAGSEAPVYCAYHSFIPLAGGSIVYAVDPYVTGNPGCDDGEHPNGKPSDGAIQGGLSHEHDESLTDPEVNAWFDSSGEEIGDKCRTLEEASEFGPALGTAPDGSRYNQVINSDFYWYQQEWSNEGSRCEQRRVFEPATIKKVSPKRGTASGGTTVTVTGSFFSTASEVMFGSVPATSFTVLSDSSLQATSPPEAAGTSVIITIVNRGGTSAGTRKARFKFIK